MFLLLIPCVQEQERCFSKKYETLFQDNTLFTRTKNGYSYIVCVSLKTPIVKAITENQS